MSLYERSIKNNHWNRDYYKNGHDIDKYFQKRSNGNIQMEENIQNNVFHTLDHKKKVGMEIFLEFSYS